MVGWSWREDGSKFIHEKAIHSSFHSLLVSFRGSLSSGMSHCYTRSATRVGEAEMSLTRVLRNMLCEKLFDFALETRNFAPRILNFARVRGSTSVDRIQR